MILKRIETHLFEQYAELEILFGNLFDLANLNDHLNLDDLMRLFL